MAPLRIPSATYRLQTSPAFRFSDIRAIIPYLDAIGISDIYLSPIFQARAGSLHGYDTVDPTRINSELGSEDDFESLVEEVRRYEMGWVQDIVPNHMAYDGANQILMDVLESGAGSSFFDYFDIDWSHSYESLRGRVLAPFLGDSYGKCLENGEIQLKYDEGGLSIHYGGLRFPLHIETYSTVFSRGLGALRKALGNRDPNFVKLLGVLHALKNLPSKEDSIGRADQIAFVKRLLWELDTGSHDIREFIDANVARFNGIKGSPESFNALDQLLSKQIFRLSFWKVATEEINYRRFFNINDLISVRNEEEKVFQHTHRLIFKLAKEKRITGLRIDHIDGLFDPARYLKRIRQNIGDLYLAVEKILASDERLPASWPVQGTTGYDFANHLNGIFCETKNEKRFTKIYTEFTGLETPYPDLASEKKRLIIGKHMAGDVDGLAHLMKNISSRDRHGVDITLYGLKRALVEILTFFPVYRTYVSYEDYSEEDHLRLQESVRRAKETNPGLLLELNFIERFLLLQSADHLSEDEKKQWIYFIMRFQQLTGPLMAKGFEDTTLYVYNRLLSLNDVGGNPGQFGRPVEAFHEFNQNRALHQPHSMSASSTHDSKRGEDVRARINALSELPEEWGKNLKRWSSLNRMNKVVLKAKEIPDRNDEYFFYQTLIGAFPLVADDYRSFCERLKNYMIKAVREAKVHTEWLKSDLAYEEGFVSFIESVLRPIESNQFLNEFLPFARKIARCGMLNSLSQTVIKIFAPGAPDFYQGSELWNLSLVDPDNRQPVDFGQRAQFLEEIRLREADDLPSLLQDLVSHPEDGKIKLYLTYKALNLRRKQRLLFQDGDYIPVRSSGRTHERVCAFIRRKGDDWALVAAPRLVAKLVGPDNFLSVRGIWGGDSLFLPQNSPRRWSNIFTGETLEVAQADSKETIPLETAFAHFPVALLSSGK